MDSFKMTPYGFYWYFWYYLTGFDSLKHILIANFRKKFVNTVLKVSMATSDTVALRGAITLCVYAQQGYAFGCVGCVHVYMWLKKLAV